jgi:sugar lactone lactonase YvrE
MRKYRRKFAPDWVRTDVTNEERAAVWELVAGGHSIARVREKLELQKIYLDRDTISKIIQEAIGEPGIPAEVVRTQKPAVQEWIISKRPHIREALSVASAGETPQPERGGGVEPTKPTAKARVEPVATVAPPTETAERVLGRYRWLRLGGIASAVIALFVMGVYLWPSPRPKPTTALPATATPAAFFTGNIVTVAGSPVPLGDGGAAAAAQLSIPLGVAIDSGNLYIADSGNNRVRRVDLATGTITTLAGNGVAGFAGDGGPATAAQLNGPGAVATASGYLYVSEGTGNRVRRVDLATGIITTFAGTGVAGSGGDGGPATAAQLNFGGGGGGGIAIASGYLYVAEGAGNRVRRVDLETGTITTFAGTGGAGSGGDGGQATAAQLNLPGGLAVGSGNLYIADVNNHRVRRIDLATGTITTFAGTGAMGFAGDGGPATAAQLNGPRCVAVDPGNLYVVDNLNNRVRRVDLATGTITTFAGTGGVGFMGDGGQATAAELNLPHGVALDSSNLYIADLVNNRVRKVELATGTITTFAGGGALSPGDGGQATAALLNGPTVLLLDSRNLYIADRLNNRVRRVDLATGIITTLAGTGVAGFGGDGGQATAAQLNSPRGLSLDSGNLYIGDSGNNRVRRVDLATGTITTFAGTGVAGFGGDGGPATAAQLNNPFGVTIASGYLYIGDYGNNRVRRVDLATGAITTFAGTGAAGFSGDGGPATAAQLNTPRFLAVGSGYLYVSDTGNYRVRRVDLATGTITTFAGTGVAGFAGDGGPATAAQFSIPLGLAVDSGNLYIADPANMRVRRVDLATGTITTFAGTGVRGFSGEGGPATAAQVNAPFCVAVDPGNLYLYIADTGNNRVRRVNLG